MTPRSPRAPRRRPRLRRLAVAGLVALTAPVVAALGASGTGTAAAERSTATAAQAPPACMGAAARAPHRPCANPALRTVVTPTPDQALLVPDAPCTPTERGRVLDVCTFGTEAPRATETVALIGDSHASHWRAAVAAVALREGWRGVSLTKSSCPFTRAQPRIAPDALGPCRDWNDEVLAWLTVHPEVRTIFVSAHSGAHVRRDPGRNTLETKIRGYAAAWRMVPESVRDIIVLRDVPTRPHGSTACIDAARAAGRPAGTTCAVPRRGALLPDPQAVAVQRRRPARVGVIDLTPFMCDARRCFPVVGGVLVTKDTDHLTRAFSTSLGPYVRSRALRLRR